MHEDIAWQVFSDNGGPIVGRGALRQDLANDSTLIVGAAHIWVWRTGDDNNVEVLLQKRALSKKTWAGYFDISAAGHIDTGEMPIQSALREAQEEIGLVIDSALLHFVQVIRTPLDGQEIDWVYLYKLPALYDELQFNDGEVDSIEWLSLDKFKQAIRDPNSYNLVPQGNAYFDALISELEGRL